MTIAEMFGQSAILSLLGMGVVFAFLTILIVFMTLVAKIIHALGWDADVQAPNQAEAVATQAAKAEPTAPVALVAPVAPVAPVGTAQNPAVVAAISAAVNQHRKTNS